MESIQQTQQSFYTVALQMEYKQWKTEEEQKTDIDNLNRTLFGSRSPQPAVIVRRSL